MEKVFPQRAVEICRRIQRLPVAHRDEAQAGDNQQYLVSGARRPKRVLRQAFDGHIVIAPPSDSAVGVSAGVPCGLFDGR